MAARKTLQLDNDSRFQLQRIVKRASDWRERERAQTLLLLDSGVFAENVAIQMGLNVRTVRITHTHWRQTGMASLADLPRSGAPRKLQPEHVERLVQWAGAEPLTAAALLARHLEAGGPVVHLNTMAATDSGCVCGLFELAASAGGKTADSDFGQRLHPQSQERAAAAGAAKKARRHAALLPPYSPELNRIERLWHKIKHTWMAVKCRTAQELEADVRHILDNVGTTYKFDLYGK